MPASRECENCTIQSPYSPIPTIPIPPSLETKDRRMMTSQKTKIVLTTALCSACLIGSASAQIFPGSSPAESSFYISGFVGAGFAQDGSFDGTQNPDPAIPATVGGSAAGAAANVDIDFGTDVYFGGAIGYQVPFVFFNTFHPRFEIEVSYLDTDVDSGSFNGGDQVFSGSQETLYIFLNNAAEIRWKDNQVLIPYIGGGLGIGVVETDIEYFPTGAPFAPEPAFRLEGDSTGFASHTTIGLNFAINNNFEIYTQGRYLRTYGIDVERRFAGGGTVDLFNADLDDDPDNFSVTSGVRVRF